MNKMAIPHSSQTFTATQASCERCKIFQVFMPRLMFWKPVFPLWQWTGMPSSNRWQLSQGNKRHGQYSKLCKKETRFKISIAKVENICIPIVIPFILFDQTSNQKLNLVLSATRSWKYFPHPYNWLNDAKESLTLMYWSQVQCYKIAVTEAKFNASRPVFSFIPSKWNHGTAMSCTLHLLSDDLFTSVLCVFPPDVFGSDSQPETHIHYAAVCDSGGTRVHIRFTNGKSMNEMIFQLHLDKNHCQCSGLRYVWIQCSTQSGLQIYELSSWQKQMCTSLIAMTGIERTWRKRPMVFWNGFHSQAWWHCHLLHLMIYRNVIYKQTAWPSFQVDLNSFLNKMSRWMSKPYLCWWEVYYTCASSLLSQFPFVFGGFAFVQVVGSGAFFLEPGRGWGAGRGLVFLPLNLRCPEHIPWLRRVHLVCGLIVHVFCTGFVCVCHSSGTDCANATSPGVVFQFFLIQALLTQWTRCHCLRGLNSDRAIFFTHQNSMIHQQFMTSPCVTWTSACQFMNLCNAFKQSQCCPLATRLQI